MCFAKVLGKKTDVSEQNFLDCGYRQNDAGGCNGAQLYSYGKTWVDKKLSLAHEAQYPYKNTVNKCNNVPKYKFGAEIVENYHTYSGDEELMKELVYKHGAVVTSLAVNTFNVETLIHLFFKILNMISKFLSLKSVFI